MALLLVLILVVATFVFWKKRSLGIYSIAALLPFERIGTFALNPSTHRPLIRPSQVAIAAFVLAGIADAKNLLSILREKTSWLLIAFVLACGIPVLAIHYSYLFTAYAVLLTLAAMVLLIRRYGSEPSVLETAYWVLFSVGVAVSLFGLFQFVGDLAGLPGSITGLREGYQKAVFGFPRIHSTALEPLYFANFMLIPLVLSLSKLVFSMKKLRAWEWLGTLTMLVAFILTMSRGAFIALIIAAAVFLIRTARRVNWKRITLLLVAALISGGVALTISSQIWFKNPSQAPTIFARLISVDINKTVSFTDRSQKRQTALQVWRHNPVFGVGIGGIGPYLHQFPKPYTTDTQVILNSHALELMAESGLVGFALYYAFLGLLLWRAWWLSGKVKNDSLSWVLPALGVAVLAIHIQAQSFSGFLLAHIWFSIGLLWAGVIVAERERVKSHG